MILYAKISQGTEVEEGFCCFLTITLCYSPQFSENGMMFN